MFNLASIIVLGHRSWGWHTTIILGAVLLVGGFHHCSVGIIDDLSVVMLGLSFFVVFCIHAVGVTNTLGLALLSILVLFFTSTGIVGCLILMEMSVIPTILIMVGWGYQPERSVASIYLFFISVASSALSLTVVFYTMYLGVNNHISYNTLIHPGTSTILLLPFLINLPVIFLHMWLPNAHVEAPTAGSVLLAGVLLKLGVYGIIRLIIIINIPTYTGAVVLLGLLFTPLVCLLQSDVNVLVAYSSISHISLLTIALFCNTEWSYWIGGAIIITHALSSSALFVVCGLLYNNYASRNMFMLHSMYLGVGFVFIFGLAIIINISTPPNMGLYVEIILYIIITNNIGTVLALYIFIYFIATSGYSLFVGISTLLNTHSTPQLNSPSLHVSDALVILLLLAVSFGLGSLMMWWV